MSSSNQGGGPPDGRGPPGGLPDAASDRAKAVLENVFGGSISRVEEVGDHPDGKRVEVEVELTLSSLVDETESRDLLTATATSDDLVAHLLARQA